jgi:deoxyribodipyrimidine photo-lyase
MMTKTIVWFRNDLRLQDNPALCAAAERGEVIPVYIIDNAAAGQWAMGGASRWWLHHSLAALTKDFKKHGVSFIVRTGDSQTVLQDLLQKTNADAVYWNRRYEPWAIAQDKKIKEVLTETENSVKSFKAALLHEPWEIQNKQGSYFKVFTPFWKHCLSISNPDVPLPVPKLQASTHGLTSESLPADPQWSTKLKNYWNPGEKNGWQRLEEFLENDIIHYAASRDYPLKNSTSRLSPHLHFGEISPRQIWYAARFLPATKFMSEIGWREFSYHLLYHYPDLPEKPFRTEFNRFPWKIDQAALIAWQRGETGYPLVDAGMRELWHTGYMHNRVRMIAASFLTKHLLIPWQLGAAWFWDTLVDADLSNNSASWQWVAGSGVDASPYFRIFNPIIQAKKFDPEGVYIRQWVSENIPPIIEHAYARERALEAYKKIF